MLSFVKRLVGPFETLNPYVRGGEAILSRLAWDVRPESWRSRKILRRWKDRFAGEKAVIVCNGPSLLKSDLSLPSEVFTFGLNKINLLFEKSDFRPSVIVAVNPHVIEQNHEFYNQTEIPLFLDKAGTRWVRARSNVAFLHSTGLNGFARDCSMSVHQGATVTYVALQLAFHMGFRRVALIGADHNFAAKGEPHRTVEARGADESHFDPNYFAGGVKWQLPDLVESERSYLLAREVYLSGGGQVVNATVGGKLEIFPRESLEAFVRGAGTDEAEGSRNAKRVSDRAP